MKRGYSIFLLKVVLAVLLTAAFTIVLFLFYKEAVNLYRKGYWLIVALYVFMYYLIANQMGAFAVGMDTAGSLIFSQIVGIAVVNVFTYFEISLIGGWWLETKGMWLLSVVEIAVIVVWSLAVTRLYFKIYPPLEMLVLYSDVKDEKLLRKYVSHSRRFVVKEYVDIKDHEDLSERIAASDAIVLSGMRNERLQEALKTCYALGKRTYIFPSVSDVLVNGAERLTIYDLPVFMVNSAGLTVGQLAIKRLVDILASIAGLVVASPIMLAVALMIRVRDGKPVIFKQNRLTRGGREFVLYKFRTMSVDAEADGVARLSSKNDKRVTPLGKKLRRARLDELPQLLNILKGDISIVGPRPERPELVEKYKKDLPEFDFRLKVKAGLTGYAQVMGKYSTTPRNKLLLDMVYIENFSFWLDVKVFLLTIRTVFTPGSAE